MSKESMNNREENSTKDRLIQILLIIIIIVLLIHNCSLMNRKEKNNDNNVIDITNDKCEKLDFNSIDCMKDTKNSLCLVPDFRGETKNELLKWLNTISNTIEIEIKIVEDSNYKDGTITSQSVIGTSVKDLLEEKTKLVIIVVNNGSLVDCENNSENSNCSLPNFANKTSEDVDSWINGLANHINIKYVYVESNEPFGIIISQTIGEGIPIKDILDRNQTLIIYVSKGKNSLNPKTSIDIYNGNQNNTDKPNKPNKTTPIPTPSEEDFFVSDNKIVRWKNEKNLNILEDSSNISKIRGKIAPESSGTYKFIINNSTNQKLKYSILFTENNLHNMNMKYKLKKGNTYIFDQYVSYDELNIDNMILNSKGSDTYYLEWKWVGDNDSNDTHIGKNATNENIKYSLKIYVEAESI